MWGENGREAKRVARETGRITERWKKQEKNEKNAEIKERVESEGTD